jgi:hypothetical protein
MLSLKYVFAFELLILLNLDNVYLFIRFITLYRIQTEVRTSITQ